MTDEVNVGEIVKPQGIRGEVKVRAGGFSERLAQLQSVRLKTRGGERAYRVLGGRAGGGFAYLRLEGVADRDAAEALRGAGVFVAREDAALGEDENFISDLIGLTAVDTQGRRIGRLTDVLRPNAVCDVYAFDTPRGEMLLPALKRAVVRVDVAEGVMVLDERALSEMAVWQDGGAQPEDE